MLEALLLRSTIPEWEIALRLLIAVILGGVIGWEREIKNRPAGLRTHMLTSLAASGFAVLSLELAATAASKGLSADPIRAIEAVTAGVAFLAAGTIIQSRGKVVGLTTGAGMWLAGALGVAAGFGFFFIAATMGAISFFVLVVLQRLSDRINSTKSDDTLDTQGSK